MLPELLQDSEPTVTHTQEPTVVVLPRVPTGTPSTSGVGSQLPPIVGRPPPEATFTPTTVGLRTGDGLQPALSRDIQALVSQTISRILTSGPNQGLHCPPMHVASYPQPHAYAVPHCDYSYRQESFHSDESVWDDEHGDKEFLDDEDLAPDRLSFTGLFCPSVFKSLLHKAKVTTNMGVNKVILILMATCLS